MKAFDLQTPLKSMPSDKDWPGQSLSELGEGLVTRSVGVHGLVRRVKGRGWSDLYPFFQEFVYHGTGQDGCSTAFYRRASRGRGPVGVCKDAPAPSKPPSPRSSSGSPPSGPTTPPGPSPPSGPVPDNLRLPAEATDVYTDKEGLELLSRSLEGHSEASFRLGMPRPREAIFSLLSCRPAKKPGR